MGGMMDVVMVGVVLVGGYYLLTQLPNLIPQVDATLGGGETFIEEPVAELPDDASASEYSRSTCKKSYNGGCRDECKGDKSTTSKCEDCVRVCKEAKGSHGAAFGCRSDLCYSYGDDKCAVCGSTSTPKTPASTTYPRNVPGQPSNCRQNSASSYVWTSGGKTSSGTSCTGARRTWCNQHTKNNCGEGGQKSTPRKTVTSTLCKCGTGTAKHVEGNCNTCKNKCKSTCGNCSPQCLGTRTNVAFAQPGSPQFIHGISDAYLMNQPRALQPSPNINFAGYT